ncbi:MAG: hypothetical protein HQM10_23695 [Candidatus Riflebacteria bacterium]|nr:hypothetical protein [Candidatus Riflebacteria bacterium]
MVKIKNILIRLLFLIFFFSILLSLRANEIFSDTENNKDNQISLDLNKIETEIFACKNKNSCNYYEQGVREILNYLKKSKNEYFFQTKDGLYYAQIEGLNVFIETVFEGSPEIKPVKFFSSAEKKFIVFQNLEMKKGVVTEWYSILEVSPDAPFNKPDFYQMWGFLRDEGESAENGLDTGEKVIKLDIKDLDNDNFPEIVFIFLKSDYKKKTSQTEFVVFKRRKTRFEKLQ